jgi:dephospho-CoA kinase
MQRTVIGIVGRKGSGKGTTAKILGERYGAKTFRFSGILSDILERLDLEKTHDNMIQMSIILRLQFGEDTLKRAMIADILKSDAQIIIIDGIRRLGDIEHLDELGNFHILNVIAPVEIRYERMTGRGEKVGENNMTYEEFKILNEAPTEVTIADVEAKAWKVIDNKGTMDELTAQLDAIMAELGIPRS